MQEKLGVCSYCQCSGIDLTTDANGYEMLSFHIAFEKICQGSYMTPETTYLRNVETSRGNNE